MSGDTITQTARPATRPALTPSRAARELDLKRGEFDLAVRLGCIRTVPDEGGGGRRVTRAEIERVRSGTGFPEALRERVKTVGTSEGATLMGITTGRFTRFARLGLIVPAKYYVNRYRAVVWLYLAEDLKRFAAGEENAPLLNSRLPEGLRGQLDTGLDLRARNWRGRHLGSLLRQAEDPWERAAAVASLLDSAQVAEIVTDPYERACLNRYLPDERVHGAPDSPAARIAARLRTAADPDEIGWLRADLVKMLEEARDRRPAPRPTTEPGSRLGSHDVHHDRPAPLDGHRMPAPLGRHRTTATRRRSATRGRPVDPRGRTEPRRPTDQRRPVVRQRPVAVPHAAEAPLQAGAGRAVEAVRPVLDGPEHPRRLLGWLRRRNS